MKPGMPPASQRCASCGRKWKQDGLSVCRSCSGQSDTKAIEAARVEARRAREATQFVVGRVKFPHERTVVVGGIEYSIAWDGTLDGAAALGVPRAEDRPGDYGEGKIWKPNQRRIAAPVSSKYAAGEEGGF